MAPPDHRPPAPPPSDRGRGVRHIAGGIAAIVVALVLTLAILPVGWLRSSAERALSASLGQPVRIGAMERIDAVSLSPRIALRDVRVAQPTWAGPGEMVTLRSATVRLPLIPLFWGSARPRDPVLDGLRLALVRDAGGRANWEGEGKASSSRRIASGTLRLTDARITLHDARRHLTLSATATADASGLRLAATGRHRDTPARLTLRAAPVTGGGRWPFRVAFASGIARLSLHGAADTPLDAGHFFAAAQASGSDIKWLDDLVQAGLPHTQPVMLTADIRHDGAVWSIHRLRGRLGGSDLRGKVVVARAGVRTRIDAVLTSNSFDFDDLTDASGRARTAARQAAIGRRLIPETPIDLAGLRTLDGSLRFEARHLRVPDGSVFRALAATLTLDRSRLVAEPLVAAMAHGRMEGRATVDQRAGTPPRLAIDLRVVGARLEDFLPAGTARGPVRAGIRLAGHGRTVRAALGHADGIVTMASRGGVVSRLVAETLGRNAGAAFSALLGAGADETPLRCFGARFRARGGTLRPEIFTLDTGVMRAEGHGTIVLNGERVTMTFDGRSKHPGLATLPAPIGLTGTLTAPTIETGDAGLVTAKTAFRTLGNAIAGLLRGRPELPAAHDADCGALMAKLG